MKRTERVGAMLQILRENPNKTFSLGYFCDMFDCAKSSLSEDVSAAKRALEISGYGRIETSAGAKGGLKYIPSISKKAAENLLNDLEEMMGEKERILANGFLYISDIMFHPAIVKGVGQIFAKKFENCGADYVVTVETKGIPAALMTAEMLNLPLVVLRRESKISEGSTVSINYFAGSAERIQKMSLAKRAVKPRTKALIIDDFMRAGGSVRGISDMMREFDVEVMGVGVMIASKEPVKKKVSEYFPLMYLGTVDADNQIIDVEQNVQAIEEVFG
ncbi:MAG: pur operon repressor [Firmicutes bacterium]|nr:pur operon repressor [Bacillota bacterium]